VKKYLDHNLLPPCYEIPSGKLMTWVSWYLSRGSGEGVVNGAGRRGEEDVDLLDHLNPRCA
jgi:hypothetical protein